jgi:large repetitive protein
VEVLDNGTQFVSFTTVSVTQPLPLGVSAVVSRRTSSGLNGRFLATITGGTGPFQVTLIDSSSSIVYQGRDTYWDYLADSGYQVSVLDSRGCSASTPLIPLPSDPSITTSVTPVSCNGGSTGIVDLTAAGGDGTYQYAITPASDTVDVTTLTWTPASTFTSLKSGSYIVYAKDGATPSTWRHKLVQVPQPTPLNVSHISTGASAGGSDGVLRIGASGGTAPYSYEVDGAVVGSSSDVVSAPGLTAGSYIISAIDSRGCVASAPASVYEKIVLTMKVTNVSCFGLSDGLVNITAVGGSGTYRYRRATRGSAAVSFQSSGVFGGLTAGIYSFYVEDALDDAYSATLTGVQVASPLAPVSILVLKTTRETYGAADGTLTLAVSGGTGGLTSVVKSSSTVASSSSGLISGLSAGNYLITTTDSNGCSSNASVTILSTLQLSVSSTRETCGSSSDGTITVNAAGGSPPFLYQILPNGASQSSPVFERLSAGNYSIRVRDSAVPAATADVTVAVEAALPLQWSLITTWRDRMVTLKVAGGNGGPYRSSFLPYYTSEVYFTQPFPRTDVFTDRLGCATTISGIAPLSERTKL